MARAWQLLVRADGDTRSAQRDIKKLQSASRGLNKAIGIDMKRIAKWGALGLGVGLAATMKIGIDEMLEAQKVSAQTAAAIRSTGGAANASQSGIENLASSLSKMSGVDDELIQSGENLLLTFTNIRNAAGAGNDVFNQTTKAALDMSVAMGEDLTSSAMRIGKAINDPVKGATALRKAGVQLTDQQIKQIKAFDKSGQSMKAQKIILAELNKEFGGSAKAFGQTSAGALSRLKNEYAELSAELVSQMAPSLSMVAKRGMAAIDSFRAWTQTTAGRAAIIQIGDAIKFVGNALVSGVSFVVQHRTAIMSLGAAYASIKVGMYVQGIVAALQTFVGAAKAAAASQGLLSAAMAASPIGAVAVGVGLLTAGITALVLSEKKKQAEFKASAQAALSQVRSLQTLQQTQNEVAGARLGVKESALQLERAEVNLAAITKAGNRNTLEGREAALAVRRARLSHMEAIGREKTAVENSSRSQKTAITAAINAQKELNKVRDQRQTYSNALSDAKKNPGLYSKKDVAEIKGIIADLDKQYADHEKTVSSTVKKGYATRNQIEVAAGGKSKAATSKAMKGVEAAFMRGVNATIKSASSQAAGMRQVGLEMSQGLASGINSGTGFVLSAAAAIMAKAKAKAREEAKSASPSRVWRDDVGLPLSQGVAVGIAAGEAGVVNATRKMMRKAGEAAKDDMNTGMRLGVDEAAASWVDDASLKLERAQDRLSKAIETKTKKDDGAAKRAADSAQRNMNKASKAQRDAAKIMNEMQRIFTRGSLETAYLTFTQQLSGVTGTPGAIRQQISQMKSEYDRLKSYLDTNARKLSASAREQIFGQLTGLLSGIQQAEQSIVDLGKQAIEDAKQVAAEIKQAMVDAQQSLSDAFDLRKAQTELAAEQTGNDKSSDLREIARQQYEALLAFYNQNAGGMTASEQANLLRQITESLKSSKASDSTSGTTIPAIPRFARGGITNGVSIAGEAGREAVVPLGSTARERMDRARVMQQAGLGGGVTINVQSASGDPEAIAQRVAKILSSRRVTVGGLA